MIDFDVETNGLQPYSGKHYPFLLVFSDGQQNVAFPWAPDKRENEDAINAWFARGQDEGIRAWNAKFDRAFAEQWGFDIPGDGCWHDGMLVAHAINERRSVALKAVARELFGEGADDLQKQVKQYLTDERKRRKKEAVANGAELVEPNYSDVPDDIMVPYALEDVILTKKVCDTYESIVEAQEDIARTVEFERKTMDALYAIEKRGMPARKEEYHALQNEVIDRLEVLEEVVEGLATEAGISDFNWRSTPQIHEALKSRKADLSFTSEKNGKFSADAENLRAIDDPLADAILKIRSEYKVLSTYVRPMIETHFENSIRAWKEPYVAPDGRIHPNYRQVGARTGRMSCSDPNMQNQPRDDLRLRYNIVADEGFKLVTCDLSNIEMVLFAAYTGEGRLLEAVRRGEDLHALTAKMLGLRDRVRPGGEIETARQLGKTYNFSRIYGGGLRTIKRSFRCSMDEARLLKQRFDDAYPEVARLQARIEYKLQEEGYVQDKLISGRRFRVDLRDAYKATNYLVQGTAASLLKLAVQQLHEDGVPMIGLVHDEIIAHVPEKDAEEVKELIVKRLTEHEELTKVVPLRADGDIVDRWSDAKPLKDENGKPYLFTPDWDGGEKRYINA